MKVLVVDDEPPARARLIHMLGEIPDTQVAGEADNGRDALKAANRPGVDLVLLDIRMPGMSGLEVAGHLARLPAPPAVVFTTAFDQHALKAFETSAVDYLLKPVRKARLEAALAKARSLTRAQLTGLQTGATPKAMLRTHLSATMQGALKIVPVEAVRLLRAEHKYVSARHPQGELLLDESLASLEAEFGKQFLRVHRNALVARRHLQGMVRASDGHHYVQLHGMDRPVAVSRRLLAEVRKALKNR